jgi:hypothetical protein
MKQEGNTVLTGDARKSAAPTIWPAEPFVNTLATFLRSPWLLDFNIGHVNLVQNYQHDAQVLIGTKKKKKSTPLERPSIPIHIHISFNFPKTPENIISDK